VGLSVGLAVALVGTPVGLAETGLWVGARVGLEVGRAVVGCSVVGLDVVMVGDMVTAE
jgi:hypothetical protein